MLNWRVKITGWEGNIIDECFNNKTSAHNFCKLYYKDSLVTQIFHYNGQFWQCVKFYV